MDIGLHYIIVFKLIYQLCKFLYGNGSNDLYNNIGLSGTVETKILADPEKCFQESFVWEIADFIAG